MAVQCNDHSTRRIHFFDMLMIQTTTPPFSPRTNVYQIYIPALLNNLQLPLPMPTKLILPLIPHPRQLLNIPPMNLIHVSLIRLPFLAHHNRPPHHNIQRPPIRHHAHIIIKHPPRKEQRNREAQDSLHNELRLVDERVLVGSDLIV